MAYSFRHEIGKAGDRLVAALIPSHGYWAEPGTVVFLADTKGFTLYMVDWRRDRRRGRCHGNIFVERLWWTVTHEWVYLRPAADGIEQTRNLGEFFDWYNLPRPHQAPVWRTPNEAYLGQSTAATALAA